MPSMLITLDTSHFERSPLNDDAEVNMKSISVALDTFQREMSPLNLSASGSGNNELISVTAETSQAPSGPCGPLEQSVGDDFRHSTMAALSSVSDRGVHPVVAYHYMRHTAGFSVWRARGTGLSHGERLRDPGRARLRRGEALGSEAEAVRVSVGSFYTGISNWLALGLYHAGWVNVVAWGWG